MGQKSHGAGESAEEADTQKQLVEGKGRTFSHDSYLMTESVGKVYVNSTGDRLKATYLRVTVTVSDFICGVNRNTSMVVHHTTIYKCI